MLIVKPIPDHDAASELCRSFGRPYDPEIMVYYATDAKDTDDPDPKPLGLCRFTLRGGKDEIVSLDYAEGTHDTEAIIITARAVMSFMYRCSVKIAYASDDVPEELTTLLGFKKTDGRFSIDLEEFYKSPCSYRA